MGKLCKSPQIGGCVFFVVIATPLLMLIACSTRDVEKEAIISFTVQALEIEAKRNDLIAYFAGLRDSVGIHGQALAIERFFSSGVPGTLRDAPPSGFEGMTSLRNRFLLLDSPQPTQYIKDAFLRVYDSEIQQALNQTKQNQADWDAPTRQLVYPEISSDSLNYWRTLADQSEGATKTLYKYKIETVWFGIQELRQQIYGRWDDTLKEQGIDVADAGITVQIASEPDFLKSGLLKAAPGLVGAGVLAYDLVGAGVLILDLPRWPELDEYYQIKGDIVINSLTGLTSTAPNRRRQYRRDNPEAEARLFVRGDISTLINRRVGGPIVEQIMRENRVNPRDVPGFEKTFGRTTLSPESANFAREGRTDGSTTAVAGSAQTWGQIAQQMDRDTIMGLADTWFPTGLPQQLSDSQEAKLRTIFRQFPLGQTDFETWYKQDLKRAFQTAQ